MWNEYLEIELPIWSIRAPLNWLFLSHEFRISHITHIWFRKSSPTSETFQHHLRLARNQILLHRYTYTILMCIFVGRIIKQQTEAKTRTLITPIIHLVDFRLIGMTNITFSLQFFLVFMFFIMVRPGVNAPQIQNSTFSLHTGNLMITRSNKICLYIEKCERIIVPFFHVTNENSNVIYEIRMWWNMRLWS